MNGIFDLGLLLLMVGYAFLNGTSAYFLKIGINKVTDIEITIKGLFRNPIRSFYKFLKVPAILLGAVLSVSGFLIYQLALINYDVSVVKPLTNFSLVFLFVWGFILLKEQITKRELFGLIAMISGVIMVSMFVEDLSTAPNISNMIIFSVIALIVCVCFILYTVLKENTKFDEYLLSIVSGIIFGLGVLFNKAIYESGFSYNLESYLYSPFTYLLVLSYFFALFIEIVAFSKGRLVMIGPIVNLIGVGIPVIGAIFIFNEALLVLIGGVLIFPLSYLKLMGIILIIIGTIAIFPKGGLFQKKEPI